MARVLILLRAPLARQAAAPTLRPPAPVALPPAAPVAVLAPPPEMPKGFAIEPVNPFECSPAEAPPADVLHAQPGANNEPALCGARGRGVYAPRYLDAVARGEQPCPACLSLLAAP